MTDRYILTLVLNFKAKWYLATKTLPPPLHPRPLKPPLLLLTRSLSPINPFPTPKNTPRSNLPSPPLHLPRNPICPLHCIHQHLIITPHNLITNRLQNARRHVIESPQIGNQTYESKPPADDDEGAGFAGGDKGEEFGG